MRRYLLCTGCRILYTARDFSRRHALLFHGRRNGGRNAIHLADRLADTLDRLYGVVCRILDFRDLGFYFLGRLGRLIRQ